MFDYYQFMNSNPLHPFIHIVAIVSWIFTKCGYYQSDPQNIVTAIWVYEICGHCQSCPQIVVKTHAEGVAEIMGNCVEIPYDYKEEKDGFR